MPNPEEGIEPNMKNKKADVDALNNSIKSLNLDSRTLHDVIERSRASLDKASLIASENTTNLRSANENLLQTGRHLNNAIRGIDQKFDKQSQSLSASVGEIGAEVVKSNVESNMRVEARYGELVQEMSVVRSEQMQVAEQILAGVAETNKETLKAIGEHNHAVIKAVRKTMIPVILLLVVLIVCVAADIVLLLLVATA